MSDKVKVVHFSENINIKPIPNGFYGGMLFFIYDDIKDDIDRLSYEFKRNPTFWNISQNKLHKFQTVENGYIEYIVYNEDLSNLHRVG